MTLNENAVDSPLSGRIHRIRDQAVMLDSDLAEVYEVETKALNRAVKRNESRFPERFAFQLIQDEWDALRRQFGTLNAGRGQHRKYLPWVFTEHGAVMLATVLNSDRAIKASMSVVDAFVRLRHLLSANAELARRIDELNAKFEKKTGEDNIRFQAIFQELKRLALGYDAEEAMPKRRIGYRTSKEREQVGRGENYPPEEELKRIFMLIYFAASLFTQSERIWNRSLAASIEKMCPRTTVMLPQDIKVKGSHTDPRTNARLFAQCVEGIDKADVLLAIVEGDDVDSGTSWEMGYAYAKGKPVIGIRTDFRPGAEHGMNLMLSRSCRYIVRDFAFQEDIAILAKDIARKLKRVGSKSVKNDEGKA